METRCGDPDCEFPKCDCCKNKRRFSQQRLIKLEKALEFLIEVKNHKDEHSKDEKPPTNNIGATHWAVCPDGDIIFYKITNTILLYGQISRMWLTPTYEAIPYTLYCFDDYDV